MTDVLWYSLPPNDTTHTVLSWGLAVFAYAYLTVMKASRIRALGYRLIGAKMLAFRGERPSILRMTLRLFLWVLFNVKDLIWAGIDRHQQSLRDRYAGTCVVKVNAIAVGEAPIHLAYYQAFTY